ncbi:MAG: phage tail tape measure protein, partial [Acinetobacter sp.]
MAQAGVIRDFMVALGFKTDNSGLKQMQDAMGGVELKATALKGALLALATGAIIAVRQTASELDKLYFSSQRIGASVTNINAYGNAVAQLGGSAEGAVGSLESLAEKMRNSPGYESQINSLGVQTKDANGAMRDRVEVMKDLSGVLSKMPAHQANAYASSLGIDQNTLLAMRDGKFVSNMDKYQKIQKELGMNDDLAKSGNEFMSEYRDLTMMTKTGFQVIVMQAGKALIPILKLLNTLIMAGVSAFSQLNPQIKEGLGIALRFGMAALVLGAFIKTFGMIFKFIPMLKGFIGLLKLFRLAFLASPIGIILALASALYLLYDDYKTWKEGGKSLIDWSKWTNGIDKIIAKIKDFLAMLEKVKDKVVNFVQKIISDPVEAIKEVVDIAKDEAKNVAQKGADALNDKIAETETGRKALDAVGSGVAKTLAFLGNKEAQK